MGRKDTFEHTFSPFEVLKHYYLAFSKEYILDFIDRVVLKGKDEMRKQRVEFAKKQISIHAGKAGVKLVESLKEEIFGAGGGRLALISVLKTWILLESLHIALKMSLKQLEWRAFLLAQKRK